MKLAAPTAVLAFLLAARFSTLAAASQGSGPGELAFNEMALSNGLDVVFLYSAPSVGASCGTGTFDPSGDLFWKAYPAESLFSANADGAPRRELSAITFEIYDSDWSNGACVYDMLISTGAATTIGPAAGVITPNFADPNAIYIPGGPFGINPCTVSPALCTAGGCPPTGYITGWRVTESFLEHGCDGSGILLRADGATDYCLTAFVPGGMTFTSGPPGACGLGDYTVMDAHSIDETQADVLGNGFSRFGGFQIGGAFAALGPEPVSEVASLRLSFCEPTLSIGAASDPTEPLSAGYPFLQTTGLAGLNAVTGAGTSFRYLVHDDVGVSPPRSLVFVASSVLPPLALPGMPLLGDRVLIDVSDPAVYASLRKGVVQSIPPAGPWAPPPLPVDGVFQSDPVVVPAAAAGITLHSQSLSLRLATLTAVTSNVVRTKFH